MYERYIRSYVIIPSLRSWRAKSISNNIPRVGAIHEVVMNNLWTWVLSLFKSNILVWKLKATTSHNLLNHNLYSLIPCLIMCMIVVSTQPRALLERLWFESTFNHKPWSYCFHIWSGIVVEEWIWTQLPFLLLVQYYSMECWQTIYGFCSMLCQREL